MTLRPPDPVPDLRRVCSWCAKVLDEGDPGAPTTHVICEECEARVMAEIQERAERGDDDGG